MEGFIVILVLYFVFKAIGKKGKGTWQTIRQAMEDTVAEPQRDTAAEPVPTAPVHRQHAKRMPPPESTMKPAGNRLMTQRLQQSASVEGSENYQTIRPTVQLNRTLGNYTGSLGTATSEGTASGEGEDTCDPALEHRRERAGYTGAYAMATEAAPTRILPVDWSGDETVRAMVLHEILNKPKAWR